MSRTIESSGAALAALCIAGMTSQANAATVTVNLNLGVANGVNSPIAIDSATPQFFYDSDLTIKETYFGAQNSGMLSSAGLTTSAVIDPDPAHYVLGPDRIKVAGFVGTVTGFIQLSFLNDSNVREFGYATITNGDLVSITYETADIIATPLPASWALLTGGVGMLGLAARRRRRRRKQAA